jgi:hypothetical protein
MMEHWRMVVERTREFEYLSLADVTPRHVASTHQNAQLF